MIINQDLYILGVDPGNRNVKTPSTPPRFAGLEVSNNPLYVDRVLYYGGKYYSHTDIRLDKRLDKTADNSYYILTLMAMGDELLAHGHRGGEYPVVLSTGVPPGNYREADLMRRTYQYYMQNESVTMEYGGYTFTLRFVDTIISPQGYASVVQILPRLEQIPRVLIVDIGGGTVDFMELVNGRPTATVFASLPWGTNRSFERITDHFENIGDPVTEALIDDVLLPNRTTVMRPEKQIVIREMAASYIEDLVRAARARNYPILDDYVVFTGGGSILFNGSINSNKTLNVFEVVEEIRANSIGFEIIANRIVDKRRVQGWSYAG